MRTLAEQINDFNIKENIQIVRENIEICASLNGRKPNDITLIGVSKHFPANAAIAAVNAGLMDLGENRVSELLEKRELLALDNLKPNWHFIGTLQRKKVKLLIGNTELVHSVDSPQLMEEISIRSEQAGIITPVLLEFNVSGEETKHGFDTSDINRIVDLILSYKGISVNGIMTMAPFTQEKIVLNNVFSDAQELFHKIRSSYGNDSFKILSMGMSNDYEIAISHGATHIRIGTAIFGQRTY